MQRVSYITLGCDKNRVDTERALWSLQKEGFEVVPGYGPAFALVINTCCFIDAAKEESIEEVMDAVAEKERGEYRVLAVVGCMVELFKEELEREIPEVDLFMGLDHADRLGEKLKKLHEKFKGVERGQKPGAGEAIQPCIEPFGRVMTTPSHYSFLKIAEGCDAVCPFCLIPKIRGPLRSEPKEELVREARSLERAGVRELNLVAQDTTAYGRDLSGESDLTSLVRELLDKTGIPWIRILYAHPENIEVSLLRIMAEEKRLVSYLDLPLQHISDRMLAAMGRRQGRREILDLLDTIMNTVPDAVLRTTFMAGYPGETEEDFNELVEFISRGRFTWASAFAFSPQPDTPAAGMPGAVDPKTTEERVREIFDVQREVTSNKLADYVGSELYVLVDEPWPALELGEGTGKEQEGKREWMGRFYGQAVEVDGAVMLEGDARPGELARARVTQSLDYDLVAEKL